MANKFLDSNGLLYFWQKLKTLLSGKVDKVDGKGLSTNDYTTTEKNKLAGIAEGATKVTVDTALSSTSTNPVQNKVINTALAGKVSSSDYAGLVTTVVGKVDKVDGKDLSTNDFTDAYKTKLEGIAEGATKVTVDTTVNASSNNAISNKAVSSALQGVSTQIQTINANLSNKLDASTAESTYAKKSDITTLFNFVGSCETLEDVGSPSADEVGKVYNIIYEFESTEEFLDGAGITYAAGTNVVGVKDGTNYYWDVLGGTMDLSNYVQTSDVITNAEIDTILAS